MAQCNEGFARTQAIQEIEYLRRAYAKATDMIGTGNVASVKEGREIYHRIFAKDVKFSVSGPGAAPLSEVGPDAWVDVVLEALGPLGPTQHLIGTQLVDISELALDGQCNLVSGRARMESYLQAWHEMPPAPAPAPAPASAPAKVWLFLGTYIDEVVYAPGVGWRIVDMNLRRVTGETRPMGDSVQAVRR